jgi:hypothetical protein
MRFTESLQRVKIMADQKTKAGREAARKNLKPFKAGESGNPNGRPPGSKNVRKAIEEISSYMVKLESNGTVQSLRAKFPEYFDEDGRASIVNLNLLRLSTGFMIEDKKTALAYMREFLDRLDGRPAQTVVRKDADGNKVEKQRFDLGDGISIEF